MLTATPATVYPLSNKQGIAIPFDVARPIAGSMALLAAEEELILPVTEGPVAIVSVFCEQYAEMQVRVSGTAVNNFCMAPNVMYDLSVMASADTTVAVVNKGTESGHAIINAVVRWTQLDNQTYGIS